MIVTMTEMETPTWHHNHPGLIGKDFNEKILQLVAYYIIPAVREGGEPSPPYQPLEFDVSILENNTLFQSEPVAQITWQPNPLNDTETLSHYRIYWYKEGDQILLGEVDADVNQFFHTPYREGYFHEFIYGVTAVTEENGESPMTVKIVPLLNQ